MLQRTQSDHTLAAWLRPLATLGLLASLNAGSAEPPTHDLPDTSAQLYQLTNLWSVHLKFTANQWEAMEPAGGPGGFFGGPGGPRQPGAFGGPGGPTDVIRPFPGNPGGAPSDFGPGMFLAPAMFRAGDQNKDGKLSRQELTNLAEQWFTAWDKSHQGHLNEDQIRNGLNASFGGGPAFANGPGGGRLPRMGLQGPEGKRNGLASAMGIEFSYVHADLDFAGHAFQDVGVRYKGNGTFLQSRGSLKRSFKVELNRYVKGQKLAGITRLNLHSNVTDPSWMNEVLAYQLYRDAGVPAPRTAFARVFVTVPGKFDHEFLGLYSLVEEVDKNFAEENLGKKKTAIFKPVTPELFADLGHDWASYRQTYDPKTDVPDASAQHLMEFCRLVSSASDADFAARLGDYVDLPEFARFMAVMVYLSDMDGILGPGQNLYVFLAAKTGLLSFVPWDQDHSFGQFPIRGTQDQRENLSLQKPWDGENRFLERIYRVDAFQKLYVAKLKEFSESIFKPERFARQVDTLAAAIRPAVQEESAEKLEQFDQVVAGQAVGPGSGGAFGGPQPGGRDRRDGPGFPGRFFQPTKPIKAFVKVRSQSVADQLAGKSNGQTVGGFAFGGPPGRGPGGPAGFGPGTFLSKPFLESLDANKDQEVTHDEFLNGFQRWFQAWDTDKSGALTEEQLRSGINRDLNPMRNATAGGPGPAPPTER